MAHLEIYVKAGKIKYIPDSALQQVCKYYSQRNDHRMGDLLV